ncbi:hypothetical protein DRF65_05560 [Chryseobacterium pennae]|uniref:HTH araC/xylS-type domain-containing protein n=1 Tax=Chryseobacterium pennae TaxID=2258962 RepID=A0A3D9CCT0_9FLAO|nr:helix-turn-helix domain-containing protein [Chryseobacterium pennae]REC63558.1 hypothetical protein DRF65_05560 [Chryseobacterium pennae]
MKKLLFLSLLSIILACTNDHSSKEKEIDRMLEQAKTMSDSRLPNRDTKKIITFYEDIEKRAETSEYKKGLMISSKYLMANYLNFAENPKKSLEYSYKTEKLAKELEDNEVIAQVHEFRGSAYLDLGFNDEAYHELQKAIIYYKNKQQHYRLYRTYQNLLNYYETTKAPQDTMVAYLNKSLHEIESVQENDSDLPFPASKYYQISRIYMNMGMFYTGVYTPQQPQLAEQYLLKSLKILEERNLTNSTNLLFVLNSLGRFYDNQQQPEKAIQYATNALQFEKQSQQIGERQISYMILANSYEVIKDKDSALKYSKLYSNLSDSIALTQKKEAGNTLVKITSQKEKNYRNNTRNIIILAVVSIITILLTGSLYLKKKKNQDKRKYQKLLDKLKGMHNWTSPKNDTEEEKRASVPIQISEETLKSILIRLEKFENSDRYLKKSVSLSSLAHALNTNQRYLTEIIKIHRGKSFSNYINGLRIEYITRKLYEDAQYREYKISYLAEECGFASHQAFITVFKKETGVTPSYFIDRLKNPAQKI